MPKSGERLAISYCGECGYGIMSGVEFVGSSQFKCTGCGIIIKSKDPSYWQRLLESNKKALKFIEAEQKKATTPKLQAFLTKRKEHILEIIAFLDL